VILVTGANGFVGRALMAELAARKSSVRGAVRRSGAILPDCECVVVGDVNENTDWHDALGDATEVVHLAARAHITHETAEDSLAAFRTINTEGTFNLARQAAQAGIRRFVFVSTIKVNGEGRESAYAETDKPAPEDAYAISKWEAEQGLHVIAAQTAMEIVILRTPLVYGPGVGANFLRLMSALDAGWPLPLGGIINRRSLIYLGNLVDAIIVSLSHSEAGGKTFLLSDLEVVSTTDLARRLAAALDTKPRLFALPRALIRQVAIVFNKRRTVDRLWGSLFVDRRKIQHELDWSPPFPMDIGLAETVKWYRSVRGDA
jgi:nucleoside-diphosphate-sugar epimerase